MGMNYFVPLNITQNVPLSKCNKPCKKIIPNAKWKWWKDAQKMKMKRGTYTSNTFSFLLPTYKKI